MPVVAKEIWLALYLVSGVNRNEFRKCLLFASLLQELFIYDTPQYQNDIDFVNKLLIY